MSRRRRRKREPLAPGWYTCTVEHVGEVTRGRHDGDVRMVLRIEANRVGKTLAGERACEEARAAGHTVVHLRPHSDLDTRKLIP